MLKISLKNTYRTHKSILVYMILLMICAGIVCDISIFRFIAIRQESLVIQENADYVVVYNSENQTEAANAVQQMLAKYEKDFDSVYSVLEHAPAMRAYYYGQDVVISAGNVPKNDHEIAIGYESAAHGKAIGDTITVWDSAFTISGIRPNRDFDEVLPSNVPAGTNMQELHFNFDHLLSRSKEKRVCETLFELFPDKELVVPERGNIYEGLLYNLRLAIMIAGIAACNLMFIFSYLIRKKKSLYSIFSICGKAKGRIVCNALAELMIYVVSSNAIGNALYYFLLYDKSIPGEYHLVQGLCISLAISVVLCLAVSLPTIMVVLSRQVLKENDAHV